MIDSKDQYGERCRACGCFLAEIDASTESGWDFDSVCNNKKCRSNRRSLPERMIMLSTPTGTMNPLFRDELERSYQPKISMERAHGYEHK